MRGWRERNRGLTARLAIASAIELRYLISRKSNADVVVGGGAVGWVGCGGGKHPSVVPHAEAIDHRLLVTTTILQEESMCRVFAGPDGVLQSVIPAVRHHRCVATPKVTVILLFGYPG